MEETKTVDVSQRLYLLIGTVVVIIAICALGQMIYQFKSLPQNMPREISVMGEAKAYAKPDIATISFGVHTQATKSQDTVNQNNEIMNKVVKSIKDSGVKDEDIQTTLYNLFPLYDYTERGSVFRGYSLDQQVQVKIRDFDKINDILDKAAANGANTIGSLQFTVDDMEKVRAKAREKAIIQARDKAKSIASQSGLRIVKLVNIYENYYPGPVPMYGMGGAGDVAVKESYAPSIQSGELRVDSTVTLVYSVK